MDYQDNPSGKKLRFKSSKGKGSKKKMTERTRKNLSIKVTSSGFGSKERKTSKNRSNQESYMHR